jgi:hypothetical protein
MATILAFPRKFPSTSPPSPTSPPAPHILHLKSSPSRHEPAQDLNRSPSPHDAAPSLPLASQISTAVARMDEQIARLAARSNIHNLSA